LRADQRGRAQSRSGRRTRNLLVAAEVVLAFVLLGCAGFLLRHVQHLRSAPLGFDPENLVTLEVAFPGTDNRAHPQRVADFYAAVQQSVGRLPGVESASITSTLPLVGARWKTHFKIAGRYSLSAQLPLASASIVAPNYFRTMKVPLRQGRDFTADDRKGRPQVAIINDAFARTHFRGENPIGQRITLRVSDDAAGLAEREIVGVVGDTQHDNLGGAATPGVFLPFAQCIGEQMTLVVRSDLPADAMIDAARSAVAAVSRNAAVYDAASMEQHLAAVAAQPRLNSVLLAIYALVAVFVATIGVYAVMAYSVVQRRHEIGVRLALGAQKSAVFRQIIGESARVVSWAVGIGAICTIIAASWLRGFMDAGAGADVWPLVAAVAVVLAAVAMIACWIPARRAMQVDPTVVLRCD
jgi:putative ABC transport system permease protein